MKQIDLRQEQEQQVIAALTEVTISNYGSTTIFDTDIKKMELKIVQPEKWSELIKLPKHTNNILTATLFNNEVEFLANIQVPECTFIISIDELSKDYRESESEEKYNKAYEKKDQKIKEIIQKNESLPYPPVPLKDIKRLLNK